MKVQNNIMQSIDQLQLPVTTHVAIQPIHFHDIPQGIYMTQEHRFVSRTKINLKIFPTLYLQSTAKHEISGQEITLLSKSYINNSNCHLLADPLKALFLFLKQLRILMQKNLCIGNTPTVFHYKACQALMFPNDVCTLMYRFRT